MLPLQYSRKFIPLPFTDAHEVEIEVTGAGGDLSAELARDHTVRYKGVLPTAVEARKRAKALLVPTALNEKIIVDRRGGPRGVAGDQRQILNLVWRSQRPHRKVTSLLPSSPCKEVGRSESCLD